jgi:hypothetical protein
MRLPLTGRSRHPAARAARDPQLDLRRFLPSPDSSVRRWSHAIRCLDGGYRVAVPELAGLIGFAEVGVGGVVGVVTVAGWELRADCPVGAASNRVEVGIRWRVLVPPGVRHRLGLTGSVVVSAAVDGSRVLVWPVGALDDVLEGLTS